MTPHGEPATSLVDSVLGAQNEWADPAGRRSRPPHRSAQLPRLVLEDVAFAVVRRQFRRAEEFLAGLPDFAEAGQQLSADAGEEVRSEERRVGNECGGWRGE